jgi:hypothetical protein
MAWYLSAPIKVCILLLKPPVEERKKLNTLLYLVVRKF